MRKSNQLTLALLVISLLIWTGCASSKIVIPNYVGTWNYNIETPQGAQDGYFTFIQEGELVAGSIGSVNGITELEKFTISEEAVSGIFYYEGYLVEVTGNFMENALEGSMNVEGYEIPFKAIKAETEE